MTEAIHNCWRASRGVWHRVCRDRAALATDSGGAEDRPENTAAATAAVAAANASTRLTSFRLLQGEAQSERSRTEEARQETSRAVRRWAQSA
jgi:hypothetical protein